MEVNASFVVPDASTRVETPLSLRSVLDRIPTGLRVYRDETDPLRRAWEEFVLPHVDAVRPRPLRDGLERRRPPRPYRSPVPELASEIRRRAASI